MSEYKQGILFPELIEETEIRKPVNVASVPQRSPFRYPGGKTWFVPTFRKWMATLNPKPDTLVEPFAGGGGISLTALFEEMTQKAVMVELDADVAAVWQSVANNEIEWLADRILKFELNIENLLKELKTTPKNIKEKAFHTILKNRTLHGGILAEGSGFIKNGENGKGILSRWYPETIAKRFLALNSIISKIDFRCEDGLEVMNEYAENENIVFFIDPPYTAGGKKAGSRLYKHSEIDHEKLFAICESIKGDFLMTYDNADEVRRMARNSGFNMRLIPMKNTHHITMKELVIGKDLSWMDMYTMVREPEAEYFSKEKKKT